MNDLGCTVVVLNSLAYYSRWKFWTFLYPSTDLTDAVIFSLRELIRRGRITELKGLFGLTLHSRGTNAYRKP